MKEQDEGKGRLGEGVELIEGGEGEEIKVEWLRPTTWCRVLQMINNETWWLPCQPSCSLRATSAATFPISWRT